jgi:hypothetical protein
MLTVYKNQNEILKSTGTTQASRLETVDKELLDVRNFSVTFDKGAQPNLEMHVYTPDGVYLTGNHKTLYSIENNDTTSQKVAYQHLSVDNVKELEALGVTRGQYKIVYNLFDNLLGSYEGQKVFIKEISPSRRELRIQLSQNSPKLVQQLNALKSRWENLLSNDIFDSFVINFGFNDTYQIINLRFDTNTDIPEIVAKLYEPLPSRFGEKSKIWISEEILVPIVESVSIVPKHIGDPVTNLAGPNFELEGTDGGSIATDFKSWNDLLSENVSTSQQLIDSYFSGSLSGIKLNINYRNFENFVHYSSASERVQNFKYKMQLIENFSNKIHFIINSIDDDGDIVEVNLNDVIAKRNAVVSSFDDFEKYLFFESEDSKLYTHYDNTTGSISPWPKKDTAAITWQEASIKWSKAANNWVINTSPIIDPYDYFAKQYETYSSTAESYYYDLLEQAEIYDKFNVHALTNTVPMQIQNSSDGEDYALFVNMISQHFDILWTYINNLTAIKYREEHPKDGMPDDLLYHVAESMGFSLLNGKSTSELWKYSLGTNADGTINSDAIPSVTTLSDESNTKEVWRRIVNNLPYILKTKGTSRAIKALITCFGIPQSVLTIKEYGGPSTFTDADHFPEYVHDVYHKAWLANGSSYVTAKTYAEGAPLPDTLEFRFKTDNNFTYEFGQSYNLVEIINSSSLARYQILLSRDNTYNNLGSIILYSHDAQTITIPGLEIFDNSWHTITIEKVNSTSATVKVSKALYGKSIYIKSGSLNNSLIAPIGAEGYVYQFANNNNGFVSTIPSPQKFKGHIHEIRFWSGSLNDNTLIEHTQSPTSYTYNVNRSARVTGEEALKPYDHLLQRYTLSNTEVENTNRQYPTQPNSTLYTKATSLNYLTISNTGSFVLEGFEETYNTPSPSLGGSSLYTNKVRIESSSLDVNKRLNTKTRIEKSSFDRYSLDSNKVGVYFSPQTAINEDIFHQLGYFEIDDYIGDPGDIYSESYNELTNFAKNYWLKYENRNDFEAYFRALEIYDFTLFKYIKKMLPQRSNAIVGLVVEPNVLERSRVRLNRKPTVEDLTYETVIAQFDLPMDMDYEDLEGEVDEMMAPPAIDFDDDRQGILDGVIINPDIDYDNIGIGELSGIAVNTNIDYDNLDIGELSGIALESNMEYDPDKLAMLENTWPKLTDSIIVKSKDGLIDLLPEFNESSITKSKDTEGSIDALPELTDSSIIKSKDGLLEKESHEPVLTDSTIIKSKDGLIEKESHTPILSDSTIIKSKDSAISVQPNTAGYISNIAKSTVLTKIDTINKTGNTWIQNRYIGQYKLTQSGSYSPIQIFVSSSRQSNSLQKTNLFYSTAASASAQLPYSSSYSFTDINREPSAGWQNARYAGCKLTATAINVNSAQTIDGGPVVKVTRVNPNKIVFANGQLTTIDEANTGIRKKSI